MGFRTQGEFEKMKSIQKKRTLKLDTSTVQKKENNTLKLITRQSEKST